MPGIASLALLLMLSSHSASAGDWNWADDTNFPQAEFQPSKALCSRLRGMQPPAEDRPSAEDGKQLKDCDSEELYYGIGMPANPVRARQCAMREAEQGDNSSNGFTGIGMLMTIYANGVGAHRDLQLATALACRVEGAAAELGGRIAHLQQLQERHWSGHDFSFCDDITSGFAGGVCARHEARLRTQRRLQRLDQIEMHWTAAQRAAWQPLLAAAQVFAEVSSENEVDLSGSARLALVADHEQEQLDVFVTLLEALESSRLPTAGIAERKAADDRLNTVFRKVMTNTDGLAGNAGEIRDAGTVTVGDVRKAQRAWIHYRDAWLQFANVRYPQRGDSLATWLTRQRTDALSGWLPASE
ncbi:lysozyme inhibitor LprI family protein [Thermomonas sp.]|uniref:lysozyme inhibitor LprI family protein n=1 Tax=Thermomonas sp. TaxID=1971895 RepID=UPI0035B0E037